MGNLIDFTGNKINSLKVKHRVGANKNGNPLWFCECDCGNSIIVTSSRLRKGQKSCRDCFLKRNKSHGMTNSKEYHSWERMKSRCYNKKDPSYEYYGKRGIAVCDRWLNNFENFLLDMGLCPEKHSLDRIDTDGNYHPINCRWASNKTQMRNRRNTIILNIEGKKLPLAEWAEMNNISRKTISERLKRGWNIKDAVTMKPLKFSDNYLKIKTL